jgi:hypothetical protein
MNKKQTADLAQTLALFNRGFVDAGYAARAVSAAIRCANKKSAQAIKDVILTPLYSDVIAHPDFII